jgi:amidase
MVAAAHANDGGGSIRIPASECGLVGLKPSRGRTSFGPDLGEALAGLVAEGVVTRSVRDTAAILDAIAGFMPGDPYVAPPPSRPYLAEVGAAPGRLRIGVLARPPGEQFQTDPECVAAVESTARLLESLGHTVEPSHPAALDEVELGQHFSLLYATSTASLLDLLGMLTGRTIGTDDVDPLNWALAELGRACTVPQFITTLDWIGGFRRRMAAWWTGGFDLLLTPTLPEPPPPLGTFKPTRENPIIAGMRASEFAAFTSPFNVTGQPAISLPLAWSSTGLPIGLHFVADYGREDLLLRIAAQLEAARPWADRRPSITA